MTRSAFVSFIPGDGVCCRRPAVHGPRSNARDGSTASHSLSDHHGPSPDDDERLDPAEPDFRRHQSAHDAPIARARRQLSPDASVRGQSREMAASAISSAASSVSTSARRMSFEYRFGIMRHLEAIASRANRGRAIEFSAKYDGWHQSDDVAGFDVRHRVDRRRQQLRREQRDGSQELRAGARSSSSPATIGTPLRAVRHALLGRQDRNKRHGRRQHRGSSASVCVCGSGGLELSQRRSRRRGSAGS